MSGFQRNAAAIYLIATLAVPLNAVASDLCTGLPASTLQVLDAKPSGLVEQKVPAEHLDQSLPSEIIGARHTTMLSTSNVIAFFEIKHRMMPRADGSVCDAPELVRIGFGSSQRIAFLTQPAADDPCVRQVMLNHEAVHAGVFGSTVHGFIDEKRAAFERGMKALKQTPAPSAEIASARWNEGLQLIVNEAKEQLMMDLRAANAQVDRPSVLVALAAACGGKIGGLGRRGVPNL